MTEIQDLIEKHGIKTVLTDSRSLADAGHSIFFALKTPTNDGHNYIEALIEQGVKAFVVERIPAGVKTEGVDFIVVNNSLEALQRLAADYRRESLANTTVIAVAGSAGKTIVKEWIAETLASQAPTGWSPRSFNSRLGVPLSILSVPSGANYAVIECGISRCGEMSVLEKIVRPNVVIMTGISEEANSESFGSYAEKCREKLSLAAAARAIIYPAELEEAVEREVPAGVMKIGVAIPPEADWTERDRLLVKTAIEYLGREFDDNIIRPLQTRLNVSQGVNNCLIIADRFSCDTHSLDSAIDFMRRRQADGLRPTLILDRLRGEVDYPALAETIKRAGISRLVAIGSEYERFRDLFPDGSRFFGSGEEMLEAMAPRNFSNELILAKGEADGPVAMLAEALQARHHETVLEVNLDAVVHNFNHYRAMLRPETGIVAMVKASGYGAGALELARTLQSQGAAYLAVAVVDEGEELRRAGITMPIMALNPKVTNYDSLFSNRLEPEVFSFGMLEEIIAEGKARGIKDYPIHIKFDTGMHRLGFLKEDIDELCRRLTQTDVVKARSVFSHLATADCLDMDRYTLEQLDLFTEICDEMKRKLGYPFLRHILNTAGIARFPQWQFELVRLGIGLYGVDTIDLPQTRDLRQVSSLKSIIISMKKWPAGTAIGYGRRTILDHEALVATVPVGYADGLNRHLSNGVGKVLVNGTVCPIIGNICMDACMIDVTEAPEVEVGTSVEFFGENHPVEIMSDALGTIPYEVISSVSPRVRRVYYRE